MKISIYMVALLLLACFVSAVAEQTAKVQVEVIEDDIKDFAFVDSKVDDPSIGDVQTRYLARYQKEKKVCEVSIFIYPSKDKLLESVYDDFDLNDKALTDFAHNQLYKQMENTYGWSSSRFFITITPEFNWSQREYKKHSCLDLLSAYLKRYPSDAANIKNYQDSRNQVNLMVSTQSIDEDDGEISIAPTITNEGKGIHLNNAKENYDDEEIGEQISKEEEAIEPIPESELKLIKDNSNEEPNQITTKKITKRKNALGTIWDTFKSFLGFK